MKPVQIEDFVEDANRYALGAPKKCMFSMQHKKLWEAFSVIDNGVKRSSGWFHRFLVPDKVLGQDARGIKLILEWEYTLPLYYPWISVGEENRSMADNQYLANAFRVFRHAKYGKFKFWIVKNIYFPLLRKFGSRAFWTGKIWPRDWQLEKVPSNCWNIMQSKRLGDKTVMLGDPDTYAEYREIYTAICREMKSKL